jgi:hypothetical protein
MRIDPTSYATRDGDIFSRSDRWGMVMIYKCFAVIGMLMLLPATVYAGPAPKELYGKSISVAWSQTSIQRLEADQRTRSIGRAVQVHIYISTAGRPFVRTVQGGAPSGYNPYREGVPVGRLGGSGETREITPGDSASNDRVNFEGHSVVLYTQFQSGARRIAIDVDTAGTNCKATVVHGRERGQNIVRTTGVGRAEVTSTEVGAVSCSIKEGNVFGQ